MKCAMCGREFDGSASDILPGKSLCRYCEVNIRELVKDEDDEAHRNAIAYVKRCKECTQDSTVRDAITNLAHEYGVDLGSNKETDATQTHSRMFDHVGEKIMSAAEIFCMLGIAICVVFGIVLCLMGADQRDGEALIAIGVVVAILGSLVTRLVSLLAYGFGEMVNNSRIQTELAQKQQK